MVGIPAVITPFQRNDLARETSPAE